MRVIERLLSLLLALALIVGAVVLAVEVGYALLDKPPALVPWRGLYERGTTSAWDTAPVRLVAAAVLLLGLLLLVGELKPRRPSRLAMRRQTEGVDTAVTRRGLRSTLVRAALEVDGISAATAKVGRRRARVSATSRLGDKAAAAALSSAVAGRAQARLDALQLARPPKLRTHVAPRRSARRS